MKAFQAEFDTRSLLQCVAPLRLLTLAHDKKKDKIIGSMVKTTAILMALGDQTPFEQMTAPAMTAMGTVTQLVGRH
jgi:hypothetical protein